MGNTVMAAAVPVNGFAPAEATQAAPIFGHRRVCVGAVAPRIMSTTLRATALPIIADGMPVRGGAGAMSAPLGLVIGREMACGGANAMPAAKMFGTRATGTCAASRRRAIARTASRCSRHPPS
jgi:hypothetical protein